MRRYDDDDYESFPAWLEFIAAVFQCALVLALSILVLGVVAVGVDTFIQVERSGVIHAWIEEHMWSSSK